MAAASAPVEEPGPREVLSNGVRVRFIRTGMAVVQLHRLRGGVLDGWLATAFRLDKTRPCLRIHYAERAWLWPNHDYLIAEARHVMEHDMTHQLAVCGEFDLEARTVRAYRERHSTAARLWLKRINPMPEAVIGYAEALHTEKPVFRPFNSVWTRELQDRAAAAAKQVWHDLQPSARDREPGGREPANPLPDHRPLRP